MSKDGSELDGAGARHARVVAHTDGGGAIRSLESTDEALSEGQLALAIDLAAAALARLGEVRGVGGLRTALVVFDRATIAIGHDGALGNAVVIGDAHATQGLVLSHLHRTLAKSSSTPKATHEDR